MEPLALCSSNRNHLKERIEYEIIFLSGNNIYLFFFMCFYRDLYCVGVQSSLAEIFLLSVADELVLSSYSTFGYISASLNGRPSYFVTRDQMCMRAISSEPCPQYWYSLYYQPWFHLNAFESGDGTNFHRCML